jgi:hypothetical protein
MTARQLERQKLHLKLNRLEDETPNTPPFKERLHKIAEARKRLNEEVEAEYLASRGLTQNSIGSFKLDDGMTDVARDEYRRLNPKPPTQKEIRESKRKERQAELERAKLTQQDILDKCNSQGECKVNESDLKNAFPKMVSLIDGNAFRPQINIKQFSEFLLNNSLTFSLPDFVFKKQA